MRWRDYNLNDNVLKLTEDATLWKNEKGIVEVSKGALAIGILLDDQPSGYIFHGKGRLLLDTIVETKKGAIGESVERIVDTPFLMLRRMMNAKEQFSDTESEDFKKLDYENQRQFISKAKDLLDMFLENSKHTNGYSKKSFEDGGFIFAFPNKKEKLDILLTKNSKLIYKAVDKIFVSKGEKMVLKSDEAVVVSKPGKSIFIEKNCGSNICIYQDDFE